MRNIPELLAPVGGPAQLYAAVNNGADAVYLGGARFNARAKADNFGAERLASAIDYAHERNVKVYVTFNTLLKDSELPEALAYGARLYEMGADAVIVQDMGLARLLARSLPDLPLHLSTQGTVYNPQAVGLIREMGFQRIVPARELTLEEIRSFAAECHAPDEKGHTCQVEVFVHGALCMCYSGQCQMSRLLGGSDGKNGVRSGNRGLCAQPCRLPYTDDRGRTSYFLSPKDLCLLEEIPALAEAGVDSFKIEGRLKSPEYVAVTTAIYRKYLDDYGRTGRVEVLPEDMEMLRQIYCRGNFTKGYLYGNPREALLSGASPKHTGIYVGRVKSVVREEDGGSDRKAIRGAARKGAVLADLELTGHLAEGDGIEICSSAKRTSSGAGGVITYLRSIPGGVRAGDIKGQFGPGDRVFKVTDRALLAKAGESFAAAAGKDRDAGKDRAADKEHGALPDLGQLDRAMKRKLPLEMVFTARVGAPARLTIREAAGAMDREAAGATDRETKLTGPDRAGKACAVFCQSEGPVEYALKRPADPERVGDQLGKLGGTPFSAKDIRVDISPDAAIPVSEINRMRREGIGLLLQKKRQTGRGPIDEESLEAERSRLESQRLQVPAPDEVKRRLGDPVSLEAFLEGEEGMPCLFSVTKGNLDRLLEEDFDEIVSRVRERGIIVNNAGWIRRLQQAGVEVFGGHGLNVYNEEARLAWAQLGVEIVEASHEADQPLDREIPLMITEHPVKSKTLTDRKGQVHRVETAPSGDKTIIW